MYGTGDPMNRALDELDQAERERNAAQARLRRIAGRHANDGTGYCEECEIPFPCPDYRDATGWAET